MAPKLVTYALATLSYYKRYIISPRSPWDSKASLNRPLLGLLGAAKPV